MSIYNLEYKVLDKLGRAKSTFHAGVFKTSEEVDLKKQKVISENKNLKLAFDVYIIDDPIFKLF